jgi:hypothetical protein
MRADRVMPYPATKHAAVLMIETDSISVIGPTPNLNHHSLIAFAWTGPFTECPTREKLVLGPPELWRTQNRL